MAAAAPRSSSPPSTPPPAGSPSYDADAERTALHNDPLLPPPPLSRLRMAEAAPHAGAWRRSGAVDGWGGALQVSERGAWIVQLDTVAGWDGNGHAVRAWAAKTAPSPAADGARVSAPAGLVCAEDSGRCTGAGGRTCPPGRAGRRRPDCHGRARCRGVGGTAPGPGGFPAQGWSRAQTAAVRGAAVLTQAHTCQESGRAGQHHLPATVDAVTGRLELLRSVAVRPPYGVADVESDNENVLRRVIALIETFDRDAGGGAGDVPA